MQSQRKKAIMAALKDGERVSFTSENIKRVPTQSGYYKFYRNGKVIYVGVGKNLRHRVESYNEKDDYDNVDGHPSKKKLRNALESNNNIKFEIHQTSMAIARKKEEILKQETQFNMDNKTNEAKKIGP